MSIFVSMAVVCTMSICNNYGIDTADKFADGIKNTQAHTIELQEAMPNEQLLIEWLKRHQIGETIFEIVSIDIETQKIDGDDIP